MQSSEMKKIVNYIQYSTISCNMNEDAFMKNDKK